MQQTQLQTAAGMAAAVGVGNGAVWWLCQMQQHAIAVVAVVAESEVVTVVAGISAVAAAGSEPGM